jgi:citrate lyase beta subunit
VPDLKRPPATWTNELKQAKAVLETPILDHHKWAKIPSIVADGFLVDVNDAVPLDRKDEARAKAIDVLSDKSFFGGRLILAKPNNLSSPWGEADLAAFGRAGIDFMLYPQTSSASELLIVQERVRQAGSDPAIVAAIETASGIANIREIAAVDRVEGLTFGAADLTQDIGMSLYMADGSYNPGLIHLMTLPVLVAAEYGLATYTTPHAPNIRDADDVGARLRLFHLLGYSGIVTFYPAHLELIYETFLPSAEEVLRARVTIDAYEAGLNRGQPAVQLESGEVILIHDYEKSKRLLAEARAARYPRGLARPRP